MSASRQRPSRGPPPAKAPVHREISIAFSSDSDGSSGDSLPVLRTSSTQGGNLFDVESDSNSDPEPRPQVTKAVSWASKTPQPSSPPAQNRPKRVDLPVIETPLPSTEKVRDSPPHVQVESAVSSSQVQVESVVSPAQTLAPLTRMFTISWVKKHGKRQQVRMFENDIPVFFAKCVRNRWAVNWIISNKVDCFDVNNSSTYIGRISQNRNSTRFSLQRSGFDTESLGLAFYVIKYDVPFRAFRFVLPKTEPYRPPSEEFELSRLAKVGEVDPNQFTLYSSVLPVKTADGRLTLSFGDVFVLKSLKNFMVVDDTGEIIFMIYRSSEGTCSLRIREPITPLIGFAISIAIVTAGNRYILVRNSSMGLHAGA
jgi:hypothetical protein